MTPEERLKSIENGLKHLAEIAASHDGNFRTIDGNFRTIARTFQTELKSIQSLERIARAHEARLARLERGKKNGR